MPSIKDMLHDALRTQLIFRPHDEPESWVADRKLVPLAFPDPPDGVALNALGQCTNGLPYKAPLTRVGPVRSGSLREFEDEEPKR